MKSEADESLSSWYKENSRVYVANDHACWADPDLTRKVARRRFGAVLRSSVNGLNQMMHEHATDAQKWILSRVTEDRHGDTTEDDGMA